ncbi:MAG TPA: hypothetical protein VJ765_13830 [Chitinophagaceae bacterium]|nr:hypothetical protein [Chitinophagaceae bacterium]
MEVHHHAHTPRKKWTHYLWEFLMLFLAVFCGFLAENQREHYIEHKREIDYVKLFVQDLKADTFSFKLANKANRENQLRMDSLMQQLKTYKMGDPTDDLYYHARNITSRGISIQYNSRTFEQLKGSGGLRLIRKSHVLDSITLYYESLKDLDIRVSHRFERLSDLFRGTEELFDGWTMDAIAEAGMAKIKNTPPLLTTDRVVMNKYVTRLGYFKATDLRVIERVEEIFFPNAVNLIALIRKEYHLE